MSCLITSPDMSSPLPTPRSSFVVSHAQTNCKRRPVAFEYLLGDALVSVEAVAKVLAVLIRGVVGEHLAAGGALEGLEAGFALDGLGGCVLLRCQSNLLSKHAFGKTGRGKFKQDVRLSTGSLPPWDRNRPCDHAFAVLCRNVSRCPSSFPEWMSYLAPLPIL